MINAQKNIENQTLAQKSDALKAQRALEDNKKKFYSKLLSSIEDILKCVSIDVRFCLVSQ